MLTRAQKKYLRSLRQKKFRTQYGRFIAEGPKVVSELLVSPLRVDELFGLPSFKCKDCAVTYIPKKDLELISGLSVPNEVVSVAHIPPQAEIDWTRPFILALDGVRDPGNLGTILRLAEWFGLTQIILSPDCAEPWSPKVVQSAMGSLFRLEVIEQPLAGFLDASRAYGFVTIGAKMDGESLYTVQTPEKMVLVMGSESHGLRPDTQSRLQRCITIPKHGKGNPIDSLNVGVATGILLDHFRQGSSSVSE